MAATAAIDRRGISFLALAHAFNDINQGVIPAIIPFLIAERHLSFAAAASLVFAMTVSSSVVQPLFGIWADKRSLPWIIPAALVVGAIGTAGIGLAPTYPLILLSAMLGGVGVAAFHPEGSRFANYVSGTQRGTGMGYFTFGGQLGFALGPIVVTPLLLVFGLSGTLYAAIPGVAIAALLWREMPRFAEFRPAPKARAVARAGRDDWRAFILLSFAIVPRAMCYFGLLTFVPLLLVNAFGQTKATANTVLAAMLIVGMAMVLYVGRLADRFDRRRVLQISLVFSIPFMLLAAYAASMHLNALVAVAAGIGALAFIVGTSSILVVLGQEYLPNRIGIASGVTLGLAVSLGGLGSPLLGAIADRWGLIPVFPTMAGMVALSLALLLWLPKPKAALSAVEEARAATQADDPVPVSA